MKSFALFFIISIALSSSARGQQTGLNPASSAKIPPSAPSAISSQITVTPDEWQELRAARALALQNNPELVAEKKKLMERMRALQDKLDAVMIGSNPAFAPNIAQFEANGPHSGVAARLPPAFNSYAVSLIRSLSKVNCEWIVITASLCRAFQLLKMPILKF